MVHDCTRNSIWRCIITVHGGTWQYKNLLNSTNWYVLECTDSYGSIRVLLDSLLQCCPAESAVLKTSPYNHTYASSSMFQSAAAGPATGFVTSPALFWRGASAAADFRGAQARMRLQQQGPVAVHRRQGQHWQGSTSLALVSLEGTGKDAVLVTNLPDKLVLWLGHRTSPRAGFLEDVLVESRERFKELCPKFVRGYGIREMRCLKLKCAGIRGVLMRNCKFLDATFVKSVFERLTIIAGY